MKTALFAATTLLVLAMAAPAAHAQKKPPANKCPANFVETCMKSCSARGGQARLCPQYCQDQKAKRGC